MARTQKLDEGKGHSIWLMPREPAVVSELQALIRDISAQYSTPIFEPHVTLIGTVLGPRQEVLEKTASLAGKINPFTISFAEAVPFDDYFKALVVELRKTPEVMRANQTAREVFGRIGDAEYMPHLSLMYAFSEYLSQNARAQVIEDFGIEAVIRRLSSFTAGALRVQYTNGKVGKWDRIRDFELGVK
jgi:hypothetical protein